MKDFAKFFSRRYSAVSTKDELSGPELNRLRRKSLKPSRSFNSSFNILDSFFNKRKPGKTTRIPKGGFLLLAGGLISILVAILIKIYQPYDLIFKWKLRFGEDGEIFNLWEKAPVDLYIKIYLFNITNPTEYLAGKEKIKVEEIGPYVYKELMSHDDVVFNDNETVSTIPRHPLVWQEHLSEGRSENDTVIMMNIALLSIAQVAADKSYLFRLPINLLIRQTKSQPLVKMTAREFMFGFESPLTTIGNTFLSDWITFDKVGLIDRMYDFSSDFETFYTGEKDSSVSGLYATYMGSKHLQQWDGDHCSDIEWASDGTKFKSFLQPNETIKFFRKSMCRAQLLVQEGNETEVDGFKTYKYVFQDNALDNGEFDKRNKCFCRKGYCQPRGLIDVTDCYYGFPISLSYPHFMDADPKLREDVLGLEPNKSKHDSFFMIQPESGLPLKLSVKFQINMHFRDIRSMAHVERFSHQTIPMVWFEIVLHELPEPLRNRFNLYLNVLPYIDTLGFWISLAGGLACVLWTVIQATLNLPQFISSTSKKLASTNNNNKKHSYSKVNLRSGVYNACEVKLMEMNEKSIPSSQGQLANIIGKNQLFQFVAGIDGEDNNDTAMCEIDLKSGENQFVLENEPALSDDDCYSKSDTSSQQITQDSNVSSSIDNDSYNEEDDASHSENRQNIDLIQDKLIHNNNNSSNQQIKNVSKNWLMGEASSLLDDIGNDQFNQNNEQNQETNNESENQNNSNQVFDPNDMV